MGQNTNTDTHEGLSLDELKARGLQVDFSSKSGPKVIPISTALRASVAAPASPTPKTQPNIVLRYKIDLKTVYLAALCITYLLSFTIIVICMVRHNYLQSIGLLALVGWLTHRGLTSTK